MKQYGPIQKKIMLTLLGGVALGCCRNPLRYYYLFRLLRNEWKNVNQQNFNRSFQRLTDEKLINEKILANGSYKLILTKKGKEQAMKFGLAEGMVDFEKPKQWDKKWRVVVFDIPEKDRFFRDILRSYLFKLQFKKLQQSVFVSPYPFENAVLGLARLYLAQSYVRVITASKIDNEDVLKKYFFKK